MPDERIFCSMNCALVTWLTNRTISDKPPKRYLAKPLAGNELAESDISDRLAGHLIPYEEMVACNYEASLTAQANLVTDAMGKVYHGLSGQQ